MKRILLFLMFALFCIPWAANAQLVVEVGEGTNWDYTTPYNSWYEYSVTELLYLNEEIEVSGTINSVSFYHIPQNSSLLDQVCEVVVYMKNVSRSSFDYGTDHEAVTVNDIVFAGSWTIPAEEGWTTITLDTPFEYDGSNLMIVVDANINYDRYRYFTYTSTEDYTVKQFTSSREDIDPYNLGSYHGSRYSTRCNIQLEIIPEGEYCRKPRHVTVGNITNHAAVVTWPAVPEAEDGYKYLYWKSSDEEPSYVEQVYDNTVTLTGLNPATKYLFKIYSVCMDMDFESTFTDPVSFTTAVACPEPTGLTATLSPSNSSVATLSWTDNAWTNRWILQYGTDYTFETKTEMNVFATTVNLTDLTPNITYYARVKAVCGGEDGESNWSIAINFTPGLGLPCPDFPTVTDFEGNVYNTVKIGSQCWMKTNLRTKKTADGGNIVYGVHGEIGDIYYYTSVPSGEGDYVYDGNYSRAVGLIPFADLGYLYSWEAANTVCPAGWHLPSDAEWTVLTDFLSNHAEYTCSGHNAKALASAQYWNTSTNTCAVGTVQLQNNVTGFSAIPSGIYKSYYDNDFEDYEYDYFDMGAFFWSSSASNDTYAWALSMDRHSTDVSRTVHGKDRALSVRCLRDVATVVVGDAQPCPGAPTVTDHEGNVYNTVKIGGQCWTKENMRCRTSPSTGTNIYRSNGRNTYTGKMAVSGYQGNLYNWNAAVDTFDINRGETSVYWDEDLAVSATFTGHRRGICPEGWHIPTNTEWMTLTSYVSANYACGYNSINNAKALASETGWEISSGECEPGDQSIYANNASGFGAYPCGWFDEMDGGLLGTIAEFWSSTQSSIDAVYCLDVSFSDDEANLYYCGKCVCHSVRCLRDPVPVVNTGSVLGVTTTSATCGGEVIADWGVDVTARGVCWSTSHNPTIADAHTSNGTGVGTFTSNLTGLAPGTTYYVRAYATNSECTAYGEEVSFVTTPTNVTVSDVTAESATIAWDGSNGGYQVRYRTPANVETFFEEGFENGLPANWITIDGDGDGHIWLSSTDYPHSGTKSMASESYYLYTQTPLIPDNWLITPQINLQGTMRVWVRALDKDYPEEHFAIYLSTTGTSVENFTIPLIGETIATSTYTEYSADLSSYAGQQGYIAIRHFNCTDMYKLLIDDFGVYGDTIPAGEWHTVSSTGTSTTLTGLIPATQYEVQVQGMCGGNLSEWSEVTDFTTDLCNLEDQCELTFVLTDSYGDGWNGNAIQVTDAETGIVLATMTNENLDGASGNVEETQTVNLGVCNGRTVNFEWVSGSWANETSYTVYDGNGEEIFSGAGGFTVPVSYTVNCCDEIVLDESNNYTYTENFDSYTTSTTTATGVEPTCWSLVQSDVSMTDANRPQLYYKSSYAHSGSYSLLLNYRGVYAMPALSEESEIPLNQMKLSMYLRQPKAYYRLQVGVWEDDGTFVPVATFNNSGTDLEFVECNFSSYTGSGRRIAFRNVLASGYSYNYSYNYIDDITLTENCEPITLPYTENFDSYTASTTAATGVEPTCWSLVQEDVEMTSSNRPQLYYKSTYAHSGSYSLLLNYRGVYAMPALSEESEIPLNQIKLSMYLRQPKAYYRLQVGVWEDGTFVPVATFNNSSTDMEYVECDFSSYRGSGRRIAFRNVLASGYSYNYSYNYIDDITLTDNCEPITLPYAENFDGYTTSTTSATGEEPKCWELMQEDVAMTDANRPQLCYNSNYAHSGNYSLLLNYRGVYAMPALSEESETPLNRVKLSMYLRQPKAYYRLQVGVWEDNGTFVPVATFNNSGTGVTHVECDFSSYRGSGRRIAFRNILASGYSYNYSYNYIDDITLTDNCEPITLPYAENFDGYTESTTAATGAEPECWELVREDVSMTDANRPQLCYNSNYAHSGSYSLLLNYRGVYAMPALSEESETPLNRVKLSMYLRQPKAYYRLQVGVWEDNGTFVPVKTFNNSGTGVTRVECDFSNYTGNGRRIAFRNVLASGYSYNYSYNYIDDITLTDICDITVPYAEDFDTYTASTTAATGEEPECWELVREDVSMTSSNRPQLYYNSSYAHSGSYSLLLNYRGVYAMPALAGTPLDQVSLSMYLRQPKAYYRLQVGVWEEDGTFVPVATFNNSGTGVTQVSCDFSSYTGSGRRIAFRNVLASGYSYNYSYNYIDDINLSRTTGKSMEVTDANAEDADIMGSGRDMLDVMVYPNPTKDVINVECTMNNVQCSGIEVVDVYGKVVRTDVETCHGASLQTQINVSGLAAGMYFVRVTTDRGVVTKPFVKK